MRILGHGVDLQETCRVERLLSNPHNDWLDGAFTEAEQAGAGPVPNITHYYAGRVRREGGRREGTRDRLLGRGHLA
jgi:phosphopantetheinyl transferase (holo-ACP synthase)